MKNIRIFYLKNCHFLVVKFSVYLNRRVFVMVSKRKFQTLEWPAKHLDSFTVVYVHGKFYINL